MTSHIFLRSFSLFTIITILVAYFTHQDFLPTRADISSASITVTVTEPATQQQPTVTATTMSTVSETTILETENAALRSKISLLQEQLSGMLSVSI
jgi:hypothetical protein